MSDDEANEVLASLIAGQPTPSKRSRNNSKSGSVKKRKRKLEAARLAKHAAADTAAAAAAAAHGKAAKAAKVTKVAKGAAPNAGLAAETGGGEKCAGDVRERRRSAGAVDSLL